MLIVAVLGQVYGSSLLGMHGWAKKRSLEPRGQKREESSEMEMETLGLDPKFTFEDPRTSSSHLTARHASNFAKGLSF